MGFKTKTKTQLKIVMPDFDPADFLCLRFYVLKTRCNDAEQKAWSRVPCGTLSERPNVRVRAAAVNMSFVRAAEGRVAGRRFLRVPILWAAKNGYDKTSDFGPVFMTLDLRLRTLDFEFINYHFDNPPLFCNKPYKLCPLCRHGEISKINRQVKCTG